VHNGQQNPSVRRKKRGVKWTGRPAGSSGSYGDDGRYLDWYRYGEIKAGSSNFWSCNARMPKLSTQMQLTNSPVPSGMRIFISDDFAVTICVLSESLLR